MSYMYCAVHSATYNPWTSVVGMRTTRSLLTTSERSTAIGITTGMIGTTGGKTKEGEVCARIRQPPCGTEKLLLRLSNAIWWAGHKYPPSG